MLRSILLRPVWLPTVFAFIVLLLMLGLLMGIAWHIQNRLQPVHNHLVEISQLQEVSLYIQNVLVEHLHRETPIETSHLWELHGQLEEILVLDEHLLSTTPGQLQRIYQTLNNETDRPRELLITVLRAVRDIITAEVEAHDRLLSQVRRDTQMEFGIATAAMIGVPLLVFLLLYFFRKRIWVPLQNLGTFMSLLAQRDYSSVPIRDVDPLLLPLFEHYNRMVVRLVKLEQEHNERRQTLENEVRTATQTVLAQQQTLADAERLAAIGEIAAGVAHELRNPLAGIQMSLNNLRRKLDDPEQTARLDLVINELKRVTHLLNDILQQARQAPEPAVTLNLARNVEELLSLVRYQVPAQIRLEQSIPEDLRCRLPQGRMRQALLNLILNAAQSLGSQSGTITVNARRENTTLYMEVYDDGAGFPPELLQSGIRAFATWRERGTGLGLALVRRFVSELGGDLQLTNRTPQGACVTLKLPCDAYHG